MRRCFIQQQGQSVHDRDLSHMQICNVVSSIKITYTHCNGNSLDTNAHMSGQGMTDIGTKAMREQFKGGTWSKHMWETLREDTDQAHQETTSDRRT